MRCFYCGNYDLLFQELKSEVNGDELVKLTEVICPSCGKTFKLEEVYKLDWYDCIIKEQCGQPHFSFYFFLLKISQSRKCQYFSPLKY